VTAAAHEHVTVLADASVAAEPRHCPPRDVRIPQPPNPPLLHVGGSHEGALPTLAPALPLLFPALLLVPRLELGGALLEHLRRLVRPGRQVLVARADLLIRPVHGVALGAQPKDSRRHRLPFLPLARSMKSRRPARPLERDDRTGLL
jgi:hypothetical protein